MARIVRKNQKIFAEDASNNGVFGSLQSNDPVTSSDPDVIQSRTAFSNGWNDATYSSELLPPLEEFQGLQYLFSRQLAYIFQEGISEWNADTVYFKGSVVKEISDADIQMYVSLTDNNSGNLVTDTTKWKKFFDSSETYKSFDLFDYKWSDYILNDQDWLRSDTFSWQDGTVYSDAYNHLVDDVDGKTAQTETVEGTTVTYYQADDGHKIVKVADVSAIETVYAATGVAWYYVLDEANQRFKLPRINPNTEQLTTLTQAPVIGNNLTMGFWDGTNAGGLIYGAGTTSLTLYPGNYGTNRGSARVGAGGITANLSIGLTPDGAKSGVIANLSASSKKSVYKGKLYLYFYVGQFSQTATEQTAGLNASLFNGKLDLDAGNATSSTKETIVRWGMPDYSAGITIQNTTGGTSGSYIAPSDGEIHVYMIPSGGTSTFTVNGYSVGGQKASTGGGYSINNYARVSAGDSIAWSTSLSGQIQAYFYPLKGV